MRKSSFYRQSHGMSLAACEPQKKKTHITAMNRTVGLLRSPATTSLVLGASGRLLKDIEPPSLYLLADERRR